MNQKNQIHIVIYSDFICPWCWIGISRLHRALQTRPQLVTRLEWRPFQLNPDMPAGGMDRQTYLTAKFGHAVEQAYAPIRQAGEAEGLDFRWHMITTTPNSLKAHALMQWVQTHHPDFAPTMAEHLFRSYFNQGNDLEDETSLRSLLPSQIKADDTLFSPGQLAMIRKMDQSARRLGIGGVPFFVTEGQYTLAGAASPKAWQAILDLGCAT
ncbi:MAG: DsbA family oxidoreductase [Pseudomonadota bacterium]